MSRILIAGCRGQLGSDCRLELLAHDVLGVDVDSIDISDRAAVTAAVSDFHPDIIINCAAYTAVDKAEEDEAAAFRANCTGPEVLAEACRLTGAALIHVSTDYVFDGDRAVPKPWHETDKPNPQTVYGRTKLAGEKAILKSGCRFAILRTAWLYGANGSNFLKTILRLAVSDPSAIRKVVNDQFGCPTYSARLARQIRKFAEAEKMPEGIFHSVCVGYATWYSFAKRFLELMGVPHNIVPCERGEFPTRAKRPSNSILSTAALERTGLCVMGDWDDALREFVRDHAAALLEEASR